MALPEMKQLVNGQKFKSQETDACIDAFQHTGRNTDMLFVSEGFTILF